MNRIITREAMTILWRNHQLYESMLQTKQLDGTGSTVQASPQNPPKIDHYSNGCPILSDGPQRDDL